MLDVTKRDRGPALSGLAVHGALCAIEPVSQVNRLRRSNPLHHFYLHNFLGQESAEPDLRGVMPYGTLTLMSILVCSAENLIHAPP